MNCRCHGDRPIYEEDMGDQFCKESFFKAWNAGAAWADAHWADMPRYDESQDTDPYGRNIKTTEATHRAMTRIAKEKPE